MSYRAAILLLQDDKIALIERHRQGFHYFTFPGGHVEEGETPEQAAVRETLDELGLEVVLRKLVARMGWQGKWQYYYLAEVTGGVFGTGRGEEMLDTLPGRGTYRPMWMPLAELLDQPVKPREMAEMVVRFSTQGWPEEPVVIPE
jgi:ADP-ribose pyrophosphatase YjhB (NUDIX family)